MAYTFDEPRLGLLQIANTDAGITPPNQATAIPTPPNVLGNVVRAFDPTFGEGEFILLKGVASTIVGSLVIWDGTTYATTLCATTANQGRPVAVSMAANTSATVFSWYQIGGTAVVAKSTSNSFAPTVALGVKSTGKVGANASGVQILGARTANAATVASATTTVNVVLNRPHLHGRLTYLAGGGFGRPRPSSRSRVQIELTCNTEDEVLFANVRQNSRLRSDWVKSLPAHDGHAVLVGGGPSLADHFPQLLARIRHGQTVFALNGAAAFLNARGVLPDYQVILDARPDNITLLSDAAEHLLASQCDPGLVSAAKGVVRLWHACVDGIDDHLPNHDDEYALIGGGTTVGLSAMCLAYTLGYRHLHLYGFDSSHREGMGHAYRQPQNLYDPLCKVTLGGKTFTASLTMAGQAERFPLCVKQLNDLGCTITVESDGLIAAVVEEMNKPAEEITEAEKYHRIWTHPQYRNVAPGEGFAENFVAICKPEPGQTVIDFGCGTGRGGKRISELVGCFVMLTDLAENCRDEGNDLPFKVSDLTKPIGLVGDLGY